MSKRKHLPWVPEEHLIAAAYFLMDATDGCSDGWSDSHMQIARAYLATMDVAHGFLPLDELRIAITTIRKNRGLKQSDHPGARRGLDDNQDPDDNRPLLKNVRMIGEETINAV